MPETPATINVSGQIGMIGHGYAAVSGLHHQPSVLLTRSAMNHLLRYFLAAFLGVVLYNAFNFALGPDEFDFAKEAVEVVLIVVFVTAVLTLFNRWRAQLKKGAS